MSVAGLKKQFHKASQLLKEKFSGVEGTRLDEDFIRMEKKTEITNKLIVDLVMKTTEYLQPNPAYRAKFSMLNKVSRIRGNTRPVRYPQTEGILGDCMLIYGAELGVETAFGSALVDMGQSLKQMAEVRDCMDTRVKHCFINPLQMLHERELKEIAYHLKKLEGRRLDFDYKKSSKRRFAETELRQALDKFEESKELAKRSMSNLLENDVDQVQQLLGLVEASMDYHQQSRDILENLRSRLQNKLTETSNRPKRKFKSKSQASTMYCTDTFGFSASSSNDTEITQELTEKGNCSYPLDQPCCRALFNFKPESQRELAFKKGEIIILTNQVDENWYEGIINGESGFFPVNYVEVLIPLPQ
ncbi:endophilin-A3b [Tachysurus fulvidraco]|uniref:Endophilin A3 n=1 Tax=Tachysurus fulvidraco TaxID=1234273 RepID=A0A5B9T649_TACFU|nr:endophilin-A3b [Tachysurus fulvidraco]QEG99575.1 endophilin A3 [Tachysurus fulvidraco]